MYRLLLKTPPKNLSELKIVSLPAPNNQHYSKELLVYIACISIYISMVVDSTHMAADKMLCSQHKDQTEPLIQ